MQNKATGWDLFAGILLLFVGVGRLLDGIWALRNDGKLADDNGLFGSSIDTYGWLWLILGIILIAAAASLFQGNAFGRIIGVVASVLSGFGALMWLPYYPVWSLVYVFIAMMVIYGLTVAPSAGDDV